MKHDESGFKYVNFMYFILDTRIFYVHNGIINKREANHEGLGNDQGIKTNRMP